VLVFVVEHRIAGYDSLDLGIGIVAFLVDIVVVATPLYRESSSVCFVVDANLHLPHLKIPWHHAIPLRPHPNHHYPKHRTPCHPRRYHQGTTMELKRGLDRNHKRVKSTHQDFQFHR
jgi:hypothetical protein